MKQSQRDCHGFLSGSLAMTNGRRLPCIERATFIAIAKESPILLKEIAIIFDSLLITLSIKL